MKQVLTSFESLILNSKYRFVLLLAGISLLISSCQKEELITSSQKEELQTSSQKQDLMNSVQNRDLRKIAVPFKGKFTLSFTETGVLLNGEGSHIGRFTLFAPNGGNTSTITAANGDQIFTTYTFSAHDDLGGGMVQASLDNTITGGTGRFARATGSFVIDALINETLGKGTGTFEGTISY